VTHSLKAAWFQPLNLECDPGFSEFAFQIYNLYRYAAGLPRYKTLVELCAMSGAASEGMGVVRSGATLIVAPSTLLGQWEREIRTKHVDGARLKILKVDRSGRKASCNEWLPFCAGVSRGGWGGRHAEHVTGNAVNIDRLDFQRKVTDLASFDVAGLYKLSDKLSGRVEFS
jgi:hypothetical protein